MSELPLGFVSWIVAGLTAFAVARFIRRHQRHYALELGVAIAGSIAAGIAATAMDFGGWQTLAPHAFAFALTAAATAIPVARLKR